MGLKPPRFSSNRKAGEVSLWKKKQFLLTLQRPGGHRCPLSLKFQFYFKKGSSKKISYERRSYESVVEKSLSWLMSRKTTKKEFGQ